MSWHQPRHPAAPHTLAEGDAQFLSLPFSDPKPKSEGLLTHYRYQPPADHDRTKPTFVLLHGFADNLHSWHAVYDYFAARGGVLAYDRPGSGLSGRPVPATPGVWPDRDNPYTFESQLEQFDGIIDHFGIEKMVLVGNSYGGLMATELARRHPERVEGIILLAGAVLSPRPPSILPKIARFRVVRWLMLLLFWLVQYFNWAVLIGLYHRPRRVSQRSKTRWENDYRLQNHVLAGLEMILANIDFPDISAQLDEVKRPVLLVHGANDRAIPARDSRKLAELWPQATLHIFERCGHVPMDEEPERFMQVTTAWLAEHLERRPVDQ